MKKLTGKQLEFEFPKEKSKVLPRIIIGILMCFLIMGAAYGFTKLIFHFL